MRIVAILVLLVCAGCAGSKVVTRYAITDTHQDGHPDIVATTVAVEVAR